MSEPAATYAAAPGPLAGHARAVGDFLREAEGDLSRARSLATRLAGAPGAAALQADVDDALHAVRSARERLGAVDLDVEIPPR